MEEYYLQALPHLIPPAPAPRVHCFDLDGIVVAVKEQMTQVDQVVPAVPPLLAPDIVDYYNLGRHIG